MTEQMKLDGSKDLPTMEILLNYFIKLAITFTIFYVKISTTLS